MSFGTIATLVTVVLWDLSLLARQKGRRIMRLPLVQYELWSRTRLAGRAKNRIMRLVIPLLSSKPDPISPLDGPALVRRRVSRWVCMGGRYPAERNPGVWGNFKPDPSSAVIAVRDGPGPLYFTGLGGDIGTAGRLNETPANNPVRRVYKLYLGDRKTRPSWDPIGVLFAVRSDADFWKIHTGGHNHIFENGTNEWRDGPETNQRLIQIQPGVKNALRDTMDQLMVQAPRAKSSK